MLEGVARSTRGAAATTSTWSACVGPGDIPTVSSASAAKSTGANNLAKGCGVMGA
jgi:hypothetical protein